MIRELGIQVERELKSKRHLIEFTLKGYPNAKNIYVVGDFSCWFPGAFPMKKEEKLWKLTLPFYPGEYRYAYVINGYKWITDPDNPNQTKNQYGVKCSTFKAGKEILTTKCKRNDGKIELKGLYHDQTWHFLSLINRTVHVKFRARKDDLTDVQLIVHSNERKQLQLKMKKIWKDKYFDYYEAVFNLSNRKTRYFFKVIDTEKVVYYSANGQNENLEKVKEFEIDEKAVNKFRVPEWVKTAVFYQIFPDRFYNGDPTNDPEKVSIWGERPTRKNFFGGDLQGIIDKLDYLEELGVNAIYLTPIFRSKSNHKYDIYDYYTVDPSFGTNNLLKKLVQEAHKKGIRVMLDAVFHHTSDEFPIFQNIVKFGVKSKYKDWYFILKYPIRLSRTYKILFHAPLPPKIKFYLIQKFHPPYETFAGVYYMPKLNLLNQETAKYFIKAAEFWVKEFKIDGLRFDVAFGIPLEFWKKLRNRLKRINPDIYLMAEFGNNFSDITYWIGAESFDAIMNYPLRAAILDFIVFEKIRAEEFHQRLMRLLTKTPREAIFCMYNMLGSHDTPRLLTLCKGDTKKAKLAIFLQMTLPGAPAIYYGDEIGMKGSGDPDCRRTMLWNKNEWNMGILEYYRKLIQIRKRNKALTHGKLETILVDNEKNVYIFKRTYQNNEILIVVNNGREDFIFKMKSNDSFEEALAKTMFKPEEKSIRVKLKPKTAVLLMRSK